MAAPTGCTYASMTFTAYCDYGTWSPPLLDSQFSASPGKVIIENVNGVIPSNALSGLYNNNSLYSGTKSLTMECGFGNGNVMTLLPDSLTANLAWAEEMLIGDCSDMEIQDNAFSALTGLQLMTFMSGNFSSILPSAFAGLTNLTTLYMYAAFPSGVPSGLFDDLFGLITLDMSRTLINSLPVGIFDNMKGLETLELLESGLTSLPDGVLLPLFNITSLSLSGNAFECDCSLQWLGDYLYDTNLATATCGSPADLAGYDLSRSLASISCDTTTIQNTDSSDDKWWHYGAVAGAGAALALSLAACCLLMCRRAKTQPPRATATHETSQPFPAGEGESFATSTKPPTYHGANTGRNVKDSKETSSSSPFGRRSTQIHVQPKHHQNMAYEDEW